MRKEVKSEVRQRDFLPFAILNKLPSRTLVRFKDIMKAQKDQNNHEYTHMKRYNKVCI